jgi:hypothetical protein
MRHMIVLKTGRRYFSTSTPLAQQAGKLLAMTALAKILRRRKTSTTPRIEFLEFHHKYNVYRPKTKLILLYSLLAIARHPACHRADKNGPVLGQNTTH